MIGSREDLIFIGGSRILVQFNRPSADLSSALRTLPLPRLHRCIRRQAKHVIV